LKISSLPIVGAHVDNLLVLSPGNWHSCSQANFNNPRGYSYDVPRQKNSLHSRGQVMLTRCMCHCQGRHQWWSNMTASLYCSWI